jgi:hypothetical protein
VWRLARSETFELIALFAVKRESVRVDPGLFEVFLLPRFLILAVYT